MEPGSNIKEKGAGRINKAPQDDSTESRMELVVRALRTDQMFLTYFSFSSPGKLGIF